MLHAQDQDHFQTLAKNYRLSGLSFSELCDHNSEVFAARTYIGEYIWGTVVRKWYTFKIKLLTLVTFRFYRFQFFCDDIIFYLFDI